MRDGALEQSGIAALSVDDRGALLHLARATIEAHFNGRTPPVVPSDTPGVRDHRGCFVTLNRRTDGRLRGCCGEYRAHRPLAESVAAMVVTSATQDPRFSAVAADELDEVHIEISALTPLASIRPEEIEIGRHGLLLRTPRAVGLLLPQVPVKWGWDTPTYLVELCRKAGLPEGTHEAPDAEIFAFEADVWGEEDDDG